VLPRANSKTRLENKTISIPAKTSTPPPTTNAPNSASKDGNVAGPNRQRRRPRKLNREPAPENVSAPSNTNTTLPPASTSELEALKSRVRGLEAKVEQLYNSGTTGRSPRRRGKGRKGSSATQVPTTSTLFESGHVEEIEDEADEELVRLEGELEVARQDLDRYNPRPRARRTGSQETEYIEEIPRGSPSVEETVNTGNRAVTLTGNYRIPLPSSVSMEDVKNIQSGVNAAQNVARSFLEQRRAAQAVQNPSTTPKPKPTPGRTRAATGKAKQPASTAVAKTQVEEDGKQSWGEWFGGYSLAISKAVKNIEAEAAIESQSTGSTGAKRPSQGARRASAPSTSKPKASGAGTAGKRPPMKARAGNLSSEQVDGLMS
jgi:hypothetical protein